MPFTRRVFSKLAAGLALVPAPAVWNSARAQAQPIKIGCSLALTGALSSVKAGLVGYEFWRDDVNASGGILGRPVELVVYDDQSSAAGIPGIYSKLIDVDKVDLLFSPYGANLTAVIMPMIKQRNKFIVGMFGVSNNDEVKHDKFFQIAPWGPNASTNWVRGYFDIAKAQGVKKIAILAADAEFSKASAAGGEKIIKEYGLDLVVNQTYPPSTTDFSGMLRNLKAAAPDAVFVCSYPPDSAALLRGVTEIGVGDSVKLFGGAMVGPQYASLLENLGSSLNGVVNFHTYVPEPTLKSAGIEKFLLRYAPVAKERGIDALGHYIPPFYYAAGEVVAAAARGANSLDEAKIAEWLHKNPVETIVGRINFDAMGDWNERRVLMVQFQGVANHNIDQFRSAGKQVIIDPPALKSGDFIGFAKARG
ncbi:MAG: amino acid ABC transporter substrate-binding protein [Hyphomicrobiales bacterium]